MFITMLFVVTKCRGKLKYTSPSNFKNIYVCINMCIYYLCKDIYVCISLKAGLLYNQQNYILNTFNDMGKDIQHK